MKYKKYRKTLFIAALCFLICSVEALAQFQVPNQQNRGAVLPNSYQKLEGLPSHQDLTKKPYYDLKDLPTKKTKKSFKNIKGNIIKKKRKPSFKITKTPGKKSRRNYKNISVLKKVRDIIKYRYIQKNINNKKLEYGAIRGMLDAINDPYARFMEPVNFKKMKARLKGKKTGIGLNLGIRNKKITIISCFPGSPAEKAGLMSLDKIIQINKIKTDKLGLREASTLIQGPKDSEVILYIRRTTSPKTIIYKIKREKFNLEPIESALVFYDEIGYIKLTTFSEKNTLSKFKSALKNLMNEGIKALIIDLRSNSGGRLSNAVDIASCFVPQGVITHIINRNGIKKTLYASGDAFFINKPLFILVDGGSASASEILAAAVQENKRAKILGANTFGKASIQQLFPLKDGSAVICTVAKYLTPLGNDITNKGIKVDYQIPISKDIQFAMTDPNFRLTFDTDYQLQKAVDYVLLNLK